MTDNPAVRNGQWPPWAKTWYGYLLRVLVALLGMTAGFFLILIGYYTAVNWKTGESNWTLGAGLTVLGGAAVAIYCVAGAIRPSKALFLPPLILLAMSVVAGVGLAIAELARNLS